MQAKVLLIDASSSRSSVLKRALIEYGYELVAKLNDTKDLLDQVEQFQPDVIVMGVDSPDQNALQQLANLNKQHPYPVVMFAEKETPQIIEQVVKAGISAFIVDDIQAHRITSIINVAIARFKEHQSIRSELEKTKTKLAERKTIEKAKGLLMAEKGCSEDEAYQCLRKMAMDKSLPLRVVSENIIEVMSLLSKTQAK